MKESLKTSLKSVGLLLTLIIAIVASAGAISTGEVIYIVCGICNILVNVYANYRIIKGNKL